MKKKRYLCYILSLVLVTGLAGCRQTEGKKVSKTVVTMMYPIMLESFEELVETTYPEIDLQIEQTTSAVMNGDSERRLRNGHGTDLIITTLPTGDVKDYMMDLSATQYSTSYQAAIMNPVMIEGKTKYLPLPGQYSGYILNKTLLEQLGEEIPSSNSELLALFETGKEKGIGIGPDEAIFGIETINAAAIGSFILGTQVPDFLGLMEGIQWMSDFDEGKASFRGSWEKSLDMISACADNGYLNVQSLIADQRNGLPVKERMQDGTLLLCYGNVRLFSQLCDENNSYEYVMLPFFSDSGNNPWVIFTPDGFIGINKELEKEGAEAQLNACQKILGLLSTQEGQEAWITDTKSTNSFLTGYSDRDNPVPEGLESCIKKGCIYSFRLSSDIIQYFGQTMLPVLEGKKEIGEALESVDDYCRNGSKDVEYDQSIAGSVSEDLLYENYNTRLEETAIGNLVADAVAEYTGADIAVVNGGGIRASLYKGDVHGADLTAVCPYQNKLVVVEAKGRVIAQMLENGISMTLRGREIPSGRFLQVSGLCYSFKPQTADRTAELISVTLPDGTAVEPDTYYKLAITNYMAGSSGYFDNNGDGYTMLNLFSEDEPKAEGVRLLEDTEATYADALRAYFYNHRDETITAKLEGRITVVNEGK